jgi:DNA polymerase-3 subunit delta
MVEEGERTLQFSADRVEGNLLAARQEIQKLALAAPDGRAVGSSRWKQPVLNVARFDALQAVRGRRPLANPPGCSACWMGAGPKVRPRCWCTTRFVSERIRALKRVKEAMAAGGPPAHGPARQPGLGHQGAAVRAGTAAITERSSADSLVGRPSVDGIVKGLKQPDWPQDGWQALHRLAQMLCLLCAPAAGTTWPGEKYADPLSRQPLARSGWPGGRAQRGG